MIYRKTLMMIICVSLFFNTAYANTTTTLFTFDANVMSPSEARFPVSGSTKEWNIALQNNLVSASSDQFDLHVPEVTEANSPFSVIRTSFRAYDNGNTQWVGDIYSGSHAEINRSGYVIVNMIDGKPHAVIKLNSGEYEIYHDQKLGSRLALVQPSNPHLFDAVDTGSYSRPAVSNTAPWVYSGNIPGTSIVDVLVLIDDDLNVSGSPIFSKIEAEKMNAELILANSGPNGIGVPLRLNVLPIETIDVPSNLEQVGCIYPFVNGGCVSPEFNTFTDGSSNISLQIINKRNNANADVVVLYVPFDPVPLNPKTSTTYDVCGIAGKPLNASQDSIFSRSFSLHASTCNLGQFVFVHEIMHNFGSAHPGENAFTPYAKGKNIAATANTDSMATLMGCQYNGDPLDPFDPGATDCDRLEHLSTPLVQVDGQTIGNAANADNVRFLTECDSSNCRRDQLAKRKNGTNPVDLLPTISILTPVDFEMIQPTSSYQLTAQAADDVGVSSVNWEVTKNGSIVSSGLGLGNDFSFDTNAFNTSGEYFISATVTDTIGQVTVDTNMIYVDSFPTASIVSPTDGQVITAVDVFTLTAQATDDVGVVSVNWTVTDVNNAVVATGAGSGNDYELMITAFSVPGNYLITVDVEDSAGQTSSDMVSVVVEPDPSKNIDITPITFLLITHG